MDNGHDDDRLHRVEVMLGQLTAQIKGLRQDVTALMVKRHKVAQTPEAMKAWANSEAAFRGLPIDREWEKCRTFWNGAVTLAKWRNWLFKALDRGQAAVVDVTEPTPKPPPVKRVYTAPVERVTLDDIKAFNQTAFHKPPQDHQIGD